MSSRYSNSNRESQGLSYNAAYGYVPTPTASPHNSWQATAEAFPLTDDLGEFETDFAQIPSPSRLPTGNCKKFCYTLLFIVVLILLGGAVGVFIGSGIEENIQVTPTTDNPTQSPVPTLPPTLNPSFSPNVSPTLNPTTSPTTPNPTQSPVPTFSPSPNPTLSPNTLNPTISPSSSPSTSPTTSNPTASPLGVPLFPVEVREDDDFIGLFFLSNTDQTGEDAFRNAAQRWSSILAGSNALIGNLEFPNSVELCQESGLFFPTTVILDHLIITADISSIDGNFGVVGRAGPCRILISNNIPFIGQMEFDSADIQRLSIEGSLESVILHEMGHVLGIGTLWSIFNIVENLLNEAEPDLSVAQPIYTGSNGVNAFNQLTGLTRTSIFVENGFTNNELNGAAGGSVNSHWDQDDMKDELMTFILQNTQPALSIVTLESLVDFGYTVDLTQADFFSNPLSVVRSSRLKRRVVNEPLIDDIIPLDIDNIWFDVKIKT